MKKKEKLKNGASSNAAEGTESTLTLTLNRQTIASLNLILNPNQYSANRPATTTCLSAKNTGCPGGAPTPTPTPKDTIIDILV